MFWDMHNEPHISVLAGNIDDTDGLDVKGHIFVEEKGDYYDIMDDLPQYEGYPADGVRDAL